ncbi:MULTISPECIES: hypothetical protein [Halobacterium]|uniref:Small CPxCG-related zinc finger protein n=4 Tax=Halobacterium salinarum TaxID=2242 RepID=A0A510N7Q6_HALSA|nr:hypothetical protein [Halobacterium salinarum]QRY23593.1 hypothetical protein JT689_06090 [Halobacterium sp. GSL-19]CAP69677.1 small CPxCG-related zinc finger protein [Halobacterium salinarum R1]DAC78262.1 TPA_inf: small CPxCG-related zinc finger protein [Halobacterium salinarum NRC-1]MBB6090233.1 Zn finger protein HypA/HybF involved in hydrogenase expression [Halobacterium salinarum]MCF2165056.1 hydrogenase maturation nickel metallochaperone HypA [Halobacterium salinarum]
MVLNRLRALVDTQPGLVRECRDCGTTLGEDSDDATVCPTCGSSEIATYDL